MMIEHHPPLVQQWLEVVMVALAFQKWDIAEQMLRVAIVIMVDNMLEANHRAEAR